MRIGIDLGGTKIEAVVLAKDNKIVFRERLPTPRGDYTATVETIGKLVDMADPKKKFPVGVGIPGVVSSHTGLVKNSNSLWLIGKPLDKDISARIGRPARLENDANCFALSEAVDGAGAGEKLVFGVILGTGVGGGIVFDRVVHKGQNGIAGEWGHNPLPWLTKEEHPGPDCYCGRKGCIEAFLSGPGMAHDHLRVTGEKIKSEAIVENYLKGEKSAVATIRRYEERLARALAGVVNLLDPDVIVLGGGLSNMEFLYDAVIQHWKNFVFSSDGVVTKIVQAKHGDSSGVRGAAWLNA